MPYPQALDHLVRALQGYLEVDDAVTADLLREGEITREQAADDDFTTRLRAILVELREANARVNGGGC